MNHPLNIHKKKFRTAFCFSLLATLFHFSCNNSAEKGISDNSEEITNTGETKKYEFDSEKWLLIETISKNGKITNKNYYKPFTDTTYNENGNPKLVRLIIDAESGSGYYSEFYESGELRHKWKESGINGGLGIMEETFYSISGEIDSVKLYQYDSGETYHDTHVIVQTILVHDNQKRRMVRYHEKFMMSEICECGLWEYFDENGNLLKIERKESCEDGKLNCIEE